MYSQPLDGVFNVLGDEVGPFQDVDHIVEAPLGHFEDLAGVVQVHQAQGRWLYQVGEIPRQTNKRRVQVWPGGRTGFRVSGAGGGSWEGWRS